MKIKSILVSQPKPADISKTPFADMMKKYGVNFTFEKFIKLDDVTASELRQEHIKDGWLVKKMVKTGFIVEIPIAKLFQGKMLTLLEKYDNNIEKLTNAILSYKNKVKLLESSYYLSELLTP